MLPLLFLDSRKLQLSKAIHDVLKASVTLGKTLLIGAPDTSRG